MVVNFIVMQAPGGFMEMRNISQENQIVLILSIELGLEKHFSCCRVDVGRRVSTLTEVINKEGKSHNQLIKFPGFSSDPFIPINYLTILIPKH